MQGEKENRDVSKYVNTFINGKKVTFSWAKVHFNPCRSLTCLYVEEFTTGYSRVMVCLKTKQNTAMKSTEKLPPAYSFIVLS